MEIKKLPYEVAEVEIVEFAKADVLEGSNELPDDEF